MDGKKIVVVVVLLAVIIVAIVVILKKGFHVGETTPKDWVLQQSEEKIDEKSFKLITKTLGEWTSLGQREGKFKNPETRKYTMVQVMECAECGEKIPLPVVPTIAPPERGEASHPPRSYNDEIGEILRTYKCPKCGALAVK